MREKSEYNKSCEQLSRKILDLSKDYAVDVTLDALLKMIGVFLISLIKVNASDRKKEISLPEIIDAVNDWKEKAADGIDETIGECLK